MGLLDSYASGSESDSEGPSAPQGVKAPVPATARPTAAKPKKRNPVRITLDLPKADGDEDKAGPGSDSDGLEQPPAKKAKLTMGKGSSALLGMLPAPKRALPVSAGGKGGLIGERKPIAVPKIKQPAADADSDDEPSTSVAASGPSKAKGKLSAPAVDLFGLAAPSSSSTSTDDLPLPSIPASISAAPEVADFVPPEPSINDPYPGFYQRPSGEWAAYDASYYESYWRNLAYTENKPKEGRDFDDIAGVDRNELPSFDVATGVDKTRKEREEAMKLTAPKTFEDMKDYKMIKPVGKSGGRSHQLSSLIQMAHQNRAMMEERIAANKRTAKAAGARYGF